MAVTDPLQVADAVRKACVLAALDGYQRAQIAGLCQEGAWECSTRPFMPASQGKLLTLEHRSSVSCGHPHEPAMICPGYIVNVSPPSTTKICPVA